jgi:plastocyanin
MRSGVLNRVRRCCAVFDSGRQGRLVTVIAVVIAYFSPLRAAEIRGRVVDAAGEGIGDAVVFVQELPPEVTAPAARRTAVMDQIRKEFVPRILPVAAGTEVSFPNYDQIHHHVYSFSRAKTFEIPLYKGEAAAPVVFDRVGAVKLGCNIHDWMSAVILVVPTPYFAKTDASGFFRIDDLPAGTHPVVAWHERAVTPIEDTLQRIEAGSEAEPLIFTLALSAPRERPRAHGVRSYE